MTKGVGWWVQLVKRELHLRASSDRPSPPHLYITGKAQTSAAVSAHRWEGVPQYLTTYLTLTGNTDRCQSGGYMLDALDIYDHITKLLYI